ncbi:MAG: hypothetical protein AAF628_20545 [Planctomycetota bacterium]
MSAPDPGPGLLDGVVHLSRSYRYAAGSGSERLARAINQGDADEAMAELETGNDVRWVSLPPGADLAPALEAPVREGFAGVADGTPPERLQLLQRFRLRCVHRQGERGVLAVGELAEQCLGAAGVQALDDEWFDGRPLLIHAQRPRARSQAAAPNPGEPPRQKILRRTSDPVEGLPANHIPPVHPPGDVMQEHVRAFAITAAFASAGVSQSPGNMFHQPVPVDPKIALIPIGFNGTPSAFSQLDLNNIKTALDTMIRENSYDQSIPQIVPFDNVNIPKSENAYNEIPYRFDAGGALFRDFLQNSSINLTQFDYRIFLLTWGAGQGEWRGFAQEGTPVSLVLSKQAASDLTEHELGPQHDRRARALLGRRPRDLVTQGRRNGMRQRGVRRSV